MIMLNHGWHTDFLIWMAVYGDETSDLFVYFVPFVVEKIFITNARRKFAVIRRV